MDNKATENSDIRVQSESVPRRWACPITPNARESVGVRSGPTSDHQI